ncbi:MAG: pyrroline-5-carboxylate reductase [Proteobacteria bacterium]|nr:pyrroline-5-carboxylate reductase [Pseudomonadota bacterium]
MLAGKKVAVVGAGNMGRALLKGVSESKAADGVEIVAYDAHPEAVRAADEKLADLLRPTLDQAVAGARLVIVAVKPQDIDALLPELESHLDESALVLSVAAGVPLARLQGFLGEKAHLIRAMPNIGALYAKGVTAIARGRFAHDEDVALAQAVLGTLGRVVEVAEELMDAVTGLSGSGPAYVFLLIEALIEAGEAQGMSPDLARVLAEDTVVGAAEIVQRTGHHPTVLKDMVTSPGGTTAAALEVFESAAFRGIVTQAVAAATQRSKELGRK